MSERQGRSSDERRDDSHRDEKGRERGRARATGAGNRSEQAPSQRARSTDPIRLLAYDVLRSVDESDAYANLVLPARLREAGLDPRDAGFATELTYGTLRMRGRYDAVLAYCVDRPLGELDDALLDALRLGAHQVLSMRVPAHAAVSQTVGLVRDRVGIGAAQLANAVLRKVAREEWPAWRARILADAADELAGLAAVESHPAWVVRALRESLVANGRDAEELRSLLEADNVPPLVTLVARPGLLDRRDLALGLEGSRAGRWSPYAVTMSSSDPGRVPSVKRGRAGVQDEGSQLVAAALTVVEVDGPDERWLDLCAGPGGKSALLAAIAGERGARIVANEVAPHRAGLVRDNLRAVPADAVESVRVGDGRTLGQEEPGSYDRVLVDAPCTGLGALRRRPESRWRRVPADVPALAQLQRELLTSALDAVRPGGVVAYVTCSPHLAETRFVVKDVLRGRDDVEVLDARKAVAAVVRENLRGDQADDDATAPELWGGSDDVQLWPHVHGTDAMHLTLLRRTASD